jgi:hypothetical protein
MGVLLKLERSFSKSSTRTLPFPNPQRKSVQVLQHCQCICEHLEKEFVNV